MSLENDPHAPAAGRELEPDPRNAAALDRRWRLWSAAGVAGVLVAGALLGFVVIPVVQGRGAGIDPFTAICRAIGILPGSPAARQPPPVASSVPVSVVAWDGRTLSAVQGASAQRGAEVAGQVCAACHGEHGFSADPQFPHLAGQSAYAIYKQLHDYKTGARVNEIMAGIAQALDDRQMADAAAYYDRQPGLELAGLGTERARQLVERGDVSRGIAACSSCHARGTGGPIEAPLLAGQYRSYTADQLRAYNFRERHNDVYARMRTIAGALTDAEITELAAYYAAAYR